MDYRFLVTGSNTELEAKVSELLKEGYEVVGPGQLVVLTTAPDNQSQVHVRFTQTLIKKEA
ncbi:DUF1737 domain-containing protein [Formicincola oecophyllae]|nr:DUF1737 domain-containing protein [Formicincola oecophyllae]